MLLLSPWKIWVISESCLNLLQELKGLVQNHGEKAVDFAERIRNLSCTAFPQENINEANVQRRLITLFVDGLIRKATRQRLTSVDPLTLDGAVAVATTEDSCYCYSVDVEVSIRGRDQTEFMEVDAVNVHPAETNKLVQVNGSR